jgi:hypothetical protein
VVELPPAIAKSGGGGAGGAKRASASAALNSMDWTWMIWSYFSSPFVERWEKGTRTPCTSR